METNFRTRYHELIEESYWEILKLLQKKGDIVLFTQDDIDQNDHMKIDIYDTIPDFPHVDSYAYCEYAAIQEVRSEGEHIYITGVYKGDNYPDKITVTLDELEGYHAIALADYLSGLEE